MSDERNTITGTSGNEELTGTLGNDQINPGNGNDTVYGGDGDDWINGYYDDQGTLLLYITTGTLTAWGGSGNDLIVGKDGNDVISGDEGNDKIGGRAGNDNIKGGDGNDTLSGDEGDDILDGGLGNDELSGNDGDDTLDGGTGFDFLEGGDGDDLYYINDLEDHIYDTGGNDTATVAISFAKIPSYIETINYAGGALPLPYWIDALVGDDSNGSYFKYLYQKSDVYYFAFPSTPPEYLQTDKYLDGYKSLSEEQKSNVRIALSNLEHYLDITFQENTETVRANTLAFAVNNQTETGAYAFLPSSGFTGSDVFIGDSEYNATLAIDTGGAATLVHEIGHALGLQHPPASLLSETESQHKWTLMSYEWTEGFDSKTLKLSELDIAALQYLYGVNKNTRAGDDVYIFNETEPNFIWDGSGNDTIDASSSPESVTIFLKPGYHGFKGQSKNELITAPGQITVNFGTEIENLIGSDQADVLTGNELNNLITGGGGSDSLDGAEGIDTAVYLVDYGGITLSNFVDYGSSGGSIQLGTAWNVVSDNETDTVRNIERLKFNDKRIALDLDEHAGQTVKLLGLLLGKDQATNPTYVGAGLKLLDDGMTYEQLMSAGLDVVLGANASSLSVVELIWNNLIGPPTPADNISQYSALIDNGTYTSAGLAIVAADHSLNTTAIDLVGLTQTGVEYIPYG